MTMLPEADSCCVELRSFVNEGKMGLRYLPRLHELSLEGRTSDWVQVLNFCPFCGTDLRSDLEAHWWQEVEQLNLDYEDFDELLTKLPTRLLTSQWWKDQG